MVTETDDKARSRTRSETDRDDKTYDSTTRMNADTNVEEALATASLAWAANMNRTYDEFLEMSLISARRSQQHFDTLMSHAQQHHDAQQALGVQYMQSCIDTANLVNKQAVAHRDLAIHHEWGAHEQVDDPRDKK